MKNLFVLARVGYEEYDPFYFEGPSEVTQTQFRQLCQSLLEEAGYNAIVAEHHDTYLGHVGWHEIVESMVPLLEKQGYRHFKPKVCVFSGSSIIDSWDEAERLGSAGPHVVGHNRKIRAQMDEEYYREQPKTQE